MNITQSSGLLRYKIFDKFQFQLAQVKNFDDSHNSQISGLISLTNFIHIFQSTDVFLLGGRWLPHLGGGTGFTQVVTLHEKYEIRPGWVGLDGGGIRMFFQCRQPVVMGN